MKNHDLFASLIVDIYDNNKNTLMHPYTNEPNSKRVAIAQKPDVSFFKSIFQINTDKKLIITEIRKEKQWLHDAQQLHLSEGLTYDKKENQKHTLLLHGYSDSDALVISYSAKTFAEFRIITKKVTQEQAIEIINLFFDCSKVNKYKLSPFDILLQELPG